MTNKEKLVLLQKDLCARLPYGVKVKNVKNNFDINTFNHNVEEIKFLIEEYNIKPYLRPMSSMTEEEKSWYESLRNALTYQENGEYDLDDFNEFNDFLNRRMLDRYGLIERRLALPAPEGMYD